MSKAWNATKSEAIYEFREEEEEEKKEVPRTAKPEGQLQVPGITF
jgi:hypothetical protein